MRPGEFRDGSWWSRFEVLTKVADDWTPTKDFIPRIDRRKAELHAPVVVPASGQVVTPIGPCSSSCEASCQIACESGEQAIVVHEHHEQVGAEFYCRYCDWSTQDEKRVRQHLESYHLDKIGQQAPLPVEQPKQEAQTVKMEGLGPTTPASEAVDPGQSGEGGAVPALDSPSSGLGLKKKEKTPDSNDFWELREEDAMYHCKKCAPPTRYPWSTSNKGAMVRHAKSTHAYEQETMSVG